MKSKKTIVVIVGLLLVFFFTYIIFSNVNKSKQVSILTETPVLNEQIKLDSNDLTAQEEVQLEVEDKSEKGIIEEIKEKVKEIVEGTINLLKEDLKIVSIGDSLTQGVGDETEHGGYVGILNHTFEENNLSITMENYGKRGNRTDQLLKRLEKEEITASIENADIALITIGGNDVMKVFKKNLTNLRMEPFEKEMGKYTDRLRAIFTKMNELNPDLHIYLIGMYNPFEPYVMDIEEFNLIMNNWNEASQLVTQEFDNVDYIPISDVFSQSTTNLLADDYFHPNTLGYKLLAKRVLESIDEISLETVIVTEEIE